MLFSVSSSLMSVAARALQQADFDFTSIAIGLAVLSLGGIGMIMAGQFFWPEAAQRYQRQIPSVLMGLVLVLVASTLIGFFQ